MSGPTSDQIARFEDFDRQIRKLEARLLLQQEADDLTQERTKTALAHHYAFLASQHARQVAALEGRTPRLWRWLRTCLKAWRRGQIKVLPVQEIARYVVTMSAIKKAGLELQPVPAISKAKGDV